METFLNSLFSQPSRCRGFGNLIIDINRIILGCGLAGLAVTTVANTSLLTSSVHTQKQLADIITGFPTFWIPESFLGFAMSGMMLVVGLSLIWIANDIEKQLRY
jgi:hypothetical protein